MAGKRETLKHNSLGSDSFFNPFGVGYSNNDGRLINNEFLSMVKNLNTFISLNRTLLDFLVLKMPIMEKVVQLPVKDAFAKNWQYKSFQYDQEEINKIEKIWEDLEILDILQKANFKARQYGGSAIILDVLPQGIDYNTKEGRQIMTELWQYPLEDQEVMEAKEIHFFSADLWELTGNNSDASSSINPQTFNLDSNDTYFLYYGKRIHRSRMILLKGDEPPSLYQPTYRGWGKSIFEGLLEPLRGFILILTLSLELASEKKIDVYIIDQLRAAITTGNWNKVKANIDFIQKSKDFTGAITIDKNDGFEQRQISLADLRDLSDLFLENFASNTYIPYKKLFGSAPNRPNNLGSGPQDEEKEDYYLLLESIQKKNVKVIKQLNSYLSLFLFKQPLDDLNIVFTNLHSLTPEQEETKKQNELTRLQTLYMMAPGLITEDIIKAVVNEANLLSIQLDEPLNSEKENKKTGILAKLFNQ